MNRHDCRACEVVLHVLKHHVDALAIVLTVCKPDELRCRCAIRRERTCTFRRHDFLEVDHILVLELAQNFYLSDSGDGKLHAKHEVGGTGT